MRIDILGGLPFVEASFNGRIEKDIIDSLNEITTQGDAFIVNDTTVLDARTKKPAVVNSATFVSKRFQTNLEAKKGWETEKVLNGQRIDGYGEFPFNGEGYVIEEDKIVDVASAIVETEKESQFKLGGHFEVIHQMYVMRKFFDLKPIYRNWQNMFDRVRSESLVRIGVEFETGNIASSFRALRKLNDLFLDGRIDCGVFVACLNKNECSGRIWPMSNRNGSFEELTNRNYKTTLSIPLMEVGFRPDGFDGHAPFLNADGTYFDLKPKTKYQTIDNTEYRVFEDSQGREYLKKI